MTMAGQGAEGSSDGSLLTVTFAERAGNALLILHHTAGASGKELGGAAQGWTQSLDKLAKFLTSRACASAASARAVPQASPARVWLATLATTPRKKTAACGGALHEGASERWLVLVARTDSATERVHRCHTGRPIHGHRDEAGGRRRQGPRASTSRTGPHARSLARHARAHRRPDGRIRAPLPLPRARARPRRSRSRAQGPPGRGRAQSP